jgi:redox-sensitive bicupin YhaK (pirin superfamily)
MSGDAQTERFHEIQLWINNPAIEKMSTPDIHNLHNNHSPSIIKKNYTLRVITGKLNGIEGKIITKEKTQIVHLIIIKKEGMEITGLERGNNVMLYIVQVSVEIKDQSIN